MAIRAHSLAVTGVEPQGSDAILLSLGVTAEQQPHFGFRPGQYLTLAVEVQGDEHWRCYSITSEPVVGQPISVLVRRVAGGRVSNWLCDHAQPGLRLKVLPPAGHFTLARPGQPVLLYAGGSGIAPVYALAREALAQGAARVRLFYTNRDRATAMLLAELQALQDAAAGRLEIVHWYDAEQGLPAQAVLVAQAQGLDQADAYMCGPEPFMHAVGASLQGRRGSMPSVCTGRTSGAAVEGASEEAAGDGPEALLTVLMKGQTHAVPVRAGELLLSAMLRAGLPAPHACRVGECASCMCRLQAGEVQRLDSSVLDEDDVAAGWLLACRTRAASPALQVRFS
uniref:Aniline dioxygenase oxidoreductase component n=1 Tax=Burkholderia sp. JS667 TaxID=622617 RepID=C3UVE3_9BURK|nr:aniline dioxygenase oxidoreductase component [Burkholderia sp. JS667]